MKYEERVEIGDRWSKPHVSKSVVVTDVVDG